MLSSRVSSGSRRSLPAAVWPESRWPSASRWDVVPLRMPILVATTARTAAMRFGLYRARIEWVLVGADRTSVGPVDRPPFSVRGGGAERVLRRRRGWPAVWRGGPFTGPAECDARNSLAGRWRAARLHASDRRRVARAAALGVASSVPAATGLWCCAHGRSRWATTAVTIAVAFTRRWMRTVRLRPCPIVLIDRSRAEKAGAPAAVGLVLMAVVTGVWSAARRRTPRAAFDAVGRAAGSGRRRPPRSVRAPSLDCGCRPCPASS